jgi:hypothetical protein
MTMDGNVPCHVQEPSSTRSYGPPKAIAHMRLRTLNSSSYKRETTKGSLDPCGFPTTHGRISCKWKLNLTKCPLGGWPENGRPGPDKNGSRPCSDVGPLMAQERSSSAAW